ncbi:nucleotidyltransferase family protein [Demequina sediminicola]|uniref:nucleotidyltransferase family protein n=1 Tax=Demequina sediminicola TaxID=1095026 RepID=UPI000782B9B8|nr:nucleotidyltransferase family protein [Demequina sediminicola]
MTLPLPVATALATAMCADGATQLGSRLLLIKGRSVEHYGLRRPRMSADIDILLQPVEAEQFVYCLEELGWKTRRGPERPEGARGHSVSLFHQAWPCDIDVHWEFPGFLEPASAVFDELWSRRVTIDVGNQPVAIPDYEGAALILALHSLRSTEDQARHARELDQLIDAVGAQDQAAALRALADATGCRHTAAPFLEQVGVITPPLPQPVPDALADWYAMTEAGGRLTAANLRAIRRLPWRRRPAAYARLAWQSEADYRLVHPETPTGWWPAFRGRLERVAEGLKAAVQARRTRDLVAKGHHPTRSRPPGGTSSGRDGEGGMS